MVYSNDAEAHLVRKIRAGLVLFMAGLVMSGITAFPLTWELHIAKALVSAFPQNNAMVEWINRVAEGVTETDQRFPFIAYGTDWLAFAHLIIAIAFIGPFRAPVRNICVVESGVLACVAIFPFAIIAGQVRGIPIFWRLIDCSFGLAGGALLWSVRQYILILEKIKTV